jgi:hypothetical protein
VAAKPIVADLDTIKAWLATLGDGLAREDHAMIDGVLRSAVPDFRGEAA